MNKFIERQKVALEARLEKKRLENRDEPINPIKRNGTPNNAVYIKTIIDD